MVSNLINEKNIYDLARYCLMIVFFSASCGRNICKVWVVVILLLGFCASWSLLVRLKKLNDGCMSAVYPLT